MNIHIEKALSLIAEEIGATHGAQAELARRLGVRPSYVNKMVKTGHVPIKQCIKIEQLLGGQVTREQLRPDVFCTKAA